MNGWRDRLGTAGWWLLMIGLALLIGWIAPQQPLVALGLGGVVLTLGVSALDAAAVPLITLPLLYVAQRLPGPVDVSVSDVALGVGTAVALVFCARPLSPPVRSLLWLTAVYQLSTLFTVVANPYPANVVEWVHEWFLVGGALVLGWCVGRGGHGSLGLKLMLMPGLTLATWVIGQAAMNYLRGDFQPIYLPYGMHKNFLGTVLGITALIAYVHPPWLRIGRRLALLSFWWMVLAIGATQSRQAVVGLSVALVVLVLRSRTDRRRSKSILLAVVPAVFAVLTLVRDQVASDNQFNSTNQRLTWFIDSLDLWSSHPLLGVGLRWWYTDRYSGGFQPPNAEMEVLTSAGLVGLVGFLVLMLGALVVLWRVEPVYGALALLAVLSRFVQAQLDIFWVAGQVSIPFVIAGICLGVQALRASDAAPLGDALPVRAASRVA
ncbi:O-antigen ligase family protein [Janibacter indicus]|uniref:O-antigen ligase family protein n=1 Tax=Janibacter indicus TaxID=857417 RepID=UPI003EBCFCFD